MGFHKWDDFPRRPNIRKGTWRRVIATENVTVQRGEMEPGVTFDGSVHRHPEDQMIIVHIEGVEGLENLSEIIQVKGLDVIFLGPYDLSQSLGIPGQVEDPRVVERMREASAEINAAGLTVGTFAGTPEAARRWIDAGVRYVSLSVDTGIYLEGCRRMVAETRGT